MNKLYKGTAEQALALAESFSRDLHDAKVDAEQYEDLDEVVYTIEMYLGEFKKAIAFNDAAEFASCVDAITTLMRVASAKYEMESNSTV